jgi:2'-5' RNA ligase
MHLRSGVGEFINSYALVSYVPGPLGSFLDHLRQELVPSCMAQSHVTILPPRELSADLDDVSRQLAADLQDFCKFSVEIADVRVFASTSVVYLGLGEGREEIIRMHRALNRSLLRAAENHEFMPHITLAQDLTPEQVPQIAELAKRRWSEFSNPRRFEVDCLTFVQNTVSNCWMDLQRYPLPDMALIGV